MPVLSKPSIIIVLLSIVGASVASAEEGPGFGKDWVIASTSSSSAVSSNTFAVKTDYALTVFLNFSGQALTRGGNDSRKNKTNMIAAQSLDYPAMQWGSMGETQGIADTVDELTVLFLKYSITFVTERPEDGDYTMIVVGGTGEGVPTDSSGTVGIAPLDCDNSYANDLGLVFGNKISSVSPQRLAYVIAHELGHTFGLEHVTDKTDIMYPALNGQTCCWKKASLSSMSSCGRSEQDANDVLADNLGLGPGDSVPPAVWFVRPGTGATLPSNFSVEVGAADELKLHHLTLYLDDKVMAEFEDPPYVIGLSGVSPGTHQLKVEAYDWHPNTSVTELSITVAPDCASFGSCYWGTEGLGGQCMTSTDCTSLSCAAKGADSSCVLACQGSGAPCPEGSSCMAQGAGWYCLADQGWQLVSGGAGGGCAVGQTKSRADEIAAYSPWAVGGLLLLLFGYIRRRR
jgi:hypothetical protein